MEYIKWSPRRALSVARYGTRSSRRQQVLLNCYRWSCLAAAICIVNELRVEEWNALFVELSEFCAMLHNQATDGRYYTSLVLFVTSLIHNYWYYV